MTLEVNKINGKARFRGAGGALSPSVGVLGGRAP